MANPILVTGAAGRVGAVGRTVTELRLKRGKAVRAMVRNEDERADLSPDRSAVREHAFLRTGVFEGAWPQDHLSGHSGRAVAAGLLERGLPVHLVNHLATMAGSAPRGTLRPGVGRRGHANGARAAARAGIRQEGCGDIHRIRKSGPTA